MVTEQVLYRRYYRAIVVDFPWAFKARAPNRNPESDRSVERHYKTMSMKEIMSFAEEMRELAHPDGCHVFMWTTGPFLEKSFDVLRAMKARYSSTAFFYLKLKKSLRGQIQLTTTDIEELENLFAVNLGFTTRKNIEPCLLGRIGSPKRKGRDVRELIIDYQMEHSRKPDETLKRVERYCDGPYLELFSRSSRPGWTHWGDEAGKFDQPAPKATKKKQVEVITPPPLQIINDPRQIAMFTESTETISE